SLNLHSPSRPILDILRGAARVSCIRAHASAHPTAHGRRLCRVPRSWPSCPGVSVRPARPTIALRRARSSPEAVLLLGIRRQRDTVAGPVGHAEGAALALRQPLEEVAGRPVDEL